MKETYVTNVTVEPNLWPTSIFPEGILERWRVADGAVVSAGEAIAEVRIGENLHELMAPAAGRIAMDAKINDIVEPGAIIGTIEWN